MKRRGAQGKEESSYAGEERKGLGRIKKGVEKERLTALSLFR